MTDLLTCSCGRCFRPSAKTPERLICARCWLRLPPKRTTNEPSATRGAKAKRAKRKRLRHEEPVKDCYTYRPAGGVSFAEVAAENRAWYAREERRRR